MRTVIEQYAVRWSWFRRRNVSTGSEDVLSAEAKMLVLQAVTSRNAQRLEGSFPLAKNQSAHSSTGAGRTGSSLSARD